MPVGKGACFNSASHHFLTLDTLINITVSISLPRSEMARTKVEVSTMMRVGPKTIKRDLDGGHLGLYQVRKTKNTVTDPRLLKIISCMASQLSGKSPGTLGKAQAAFKSARQGPCKI